MKKILLSLLLINLLGCGDKTNENGFYIEGKDIGIHKETKTKYDINGYDINGYNSQGYNKNGYDKDGLDKNGYDKNGVFQEKEYKLKLLRTGQLDIDDKISSEKISLFFYDDIERIALKRFDSTKDSLKKGEFEKTSEYEERLKRYTDEQEQNIKKFQNGIYIAMKPAYGKYDADKEIWKIDLYPNFDFKVTNDYDYKCNIRLNFPSNLEGSKITKIKSTFGTDEFIYNYPMKLDKAKDKKFLNVKVKYLFKFIPENFYETSGKFTKNYTKIEYAIDFYGTIIGYQLSIDDKVIEEQIFN